MDPKAQEILNKYKDKIPVEVVNIALELGVKAVSEASDFVAK